MSRIKWDQTGERKFQTGCDRGVLYKQANGAYPSGEAWNGLTGVTQNPSGAEENPIYADNIKYLSLLSAETFGATIECLWYPDSFAECNGEISIGAVNVGMQRRKTFGFSWRNKIGNDTEGEDHGFMIHLAYGCKASPTDISNETINESPDAATLSYTVTTTPVNVDGKDEDGKAYRPTAHISIDSTKIINPDLLELFEKIIYGFDNNDQFLADHVFGENSDMSWATKFFDVEITGSGNNIGGLDARLPLPDEVLEIFTHDGLG